MLQFILLRSIYFYFILFYCTRNHAHGQTQIIQYASRNETTVRISIFFTKYADSSEFAIAWRRNVIPDIRLEFRFSEFLAPRSTCNEAFIFPIFSRTLQFAIAMFGYCHSKPMSSICRLSSRCRLWRECTVTRRLKLGSRCFHTKVAVVLTFSVISLTAKF